MLGDTLVLASISSPRWAMWPGSPAAGGLSFDRHDVLGAAAAAVLLLPIIVALLAVGGSAPGSGGGLDAVLAGESAISRSSSLSSAGILWYWALGKGGIARVGVLQFLQPVSGVILASLLLGEGVNLSFIAASTMILFGVWLALKGK